MKALEDENRKLKKLLAEQVLDNATLKEILKKLLTPGERRSAVSWAINKKSYSQARACTLVGMHTRTYRRSRDVEEMVCFARV